VHNKQIRGRASGKHRHRGERTEQSTMSGEKVKSDENSSSSSAENATSETKKDVTEEKAQSSKHKRSKTAGEVEPSASPSPTEP
jgi:hypothetical protein